MVDTIGLGPIIERCGGSTPLLGTCWKQHNFKFPIRQLADRFLIFKQS